MISKVLISALSITLSRGITSAVEMKGKKNLLQALKYIEPAEHFFRILFNWDVR
jgi:hypothetical protein